MELNLIEIFKVIDEIMSDISSFLKVQPVTESEEDKKNIDLLTKFSGSLLPSFKNELGVNQKILGDEILTNIMLDSLNNLKGSLISIILSNDKNFKKLSSLVEQSYKIYNIRRDFRLFKALILNYNKKIEDLEKKLVNNYNDRFENEIEFVKEKLEKVLSQNKRKYESEINDIGLRLNTIMENNDKTLGVLFNSYEKEFQDIKNNQFEERRNKNKAFDEFMSEMVLIRDGLIDKFDKSYNKIQADWGAIQQIKTNNVYLNAYHKNTTRSKKGENKFIGVTALSLFLSVLTIIAFIFNAIDFSQFISIKIMIVVFFGILIAYYLRISTHYRRLADQAEQTHLELLAFPQYATELGEEKYREIKEQLAFKYFGKEIDPSGYQKIGDIAHEQLKTSSELVKAAASLSVASTKTTENSTSNKPRNSTSQSEANGG